MHCRAVYAHPRRRSALVQCLGKRDPNHRPGPSDAVDVWMLVVIGSMVQYRKAVESLLRAKVAKGVLLPDAFTHAVRGHRVALNSHFDTILLFAESFVRNASARVRDAGVHLYTLLFGEFDTHYNRQQVVGFLLGHIGSKAATEVDAAFAVFKVRVVRERWVVAAPIPCG